MTLHPEALRALHTAAPGRVRTSVMLADLGWWRIGGPAEVVVDQPSEPELIDVLRAMTRFGVKPVIIGHGANLLFDDAGYRGVIVRIGERMSAVSVLGDGLVEAQAGVWTPAFVRRVINAGLDGAGHAVGIPGTLGGLVVMNGGSQRRSIGEHLTSVRALGPDGVVRTLKRSQLALGYRRSALQHDHVLLSASFRFEAAPRPALRREAVALLAGRRRKFPRSDPNCGSVFVSDPALYEAFGPPGQAIERAGLKGVAIGGAAISERHANVIVNRGGARSSDVLSLISLARNAVAQETGCLMLCEVKHLPPSSHLRPAHESL